MFEIQPSSYSRLIPICQKENISFPLIESVIHNKQRGQVFVDDKKNPSTALVATRFGFIRLLSGNPSEVINQSIANIFTQESILQPNYILWYAPPEPWTSRLDMLLSASVRRRERTRFIFEPGKAHYLDDNEVVSSEYQLRVLDSETLPQTEHLNLNIESRFWNSTEDFLNYGIGVCLVKADKVVSVCYSTCVVNGLAEVDIVTDKDYQGNGFASIVAREFIRNCLAKNILPTWDCFNHNIPSWRLAKKLGFTPHTSYSFYSFNIPLTI